jgi:hypothetical protein
LKLVDDVSCKIVIPGISRRSLMGDFLLKGVMKNRIELRESLISQAKSGKRYWVTRLKKEDGSDGGPLRFVNPIMGGIYSSIHDLCVLQAIEQQDSFWLAGFVARLTVVPTDFAM